MEKELTKYQEYYRNNREQEKISSQRYFRGKRKAIFALLGDKCAICAFDDIRALQVDHINGGGVKDRKVKGMSYTNRIIKSVLNKENKFQILCANCNWIKRSINNENRK